ncbi:hypothetical protein T484DRAFT_1648148, partial [Baffinella frigidus]
MSGIHSLQNRVRYAGNPNVVNRHGTTLLIEAVRTDDTTMVQMLLDQGASIDLFDKDRSTALAEACYQLHIGSVRLLLGRGASLE